MPPVIFRVDATSQIALGHLKRCLSIAEALSSVGIDSVFISFSEESAAKILGESGFKYFLIDSPVNRGNDTDETRRIINEVGSNAIVLDSYDINAAYIELLKESGQVVICADDFADRYLPCDLLINGGLGAEKLPYDDKKIKYLLGIEFCVLSKSFWNSAFVIREKIQNVLITMGGIDHFNLSVRSLQILEKVDADISATVIIGPYYEQVSEIEKQAESMSKKVCLVQNSNNLYDDMKRCDLAISAGGRTLYELASLGRPIIGLSLAENQAYNVQELDSQKAICGLTYHDAPSFDDELEGAIISFLDSPQKSLDLAKKAHELFSGNGALTVANEIASLLNRCQVQAS
ncbi:MAG: UDP-2,4-diacetamido-2,4,6-trideoxy-beta-L-altropyranose hydrolase [Planctomycetes bacterium]|nr:UDP-2,4-diacetamido-2,4,6-trideoxy-beta-L-altropyranose hydrolase [Planctomycetota bacterium]